MNGADVVCQAAARAQDAGGGATLARSDLPARAIVGSNAVGISTAG